MDFNCVLIGTHCNCTLVLITLKMATGVVENISG